MSTKQARVEVYINDEQAQARLADIQAELKQVKALRDKAGAAGDVKGFIQLQNETKKLTRDANQLQRKVVDVQTVLNNMKAVSINDLEKAMRKANAEFAAMKRNDPGFAQKAREVSLLRTELNNATGAAKAKESIMSKLAATSNKYFTMLTGVAAMITGIAFSVKEWVKGLVGMDDALANVMKTTGLTRKEVRELYTEFGFLNTRTARKELLLLAEEAGRLGRESKKDVMDFVEVGNMIQVALGDDLGGEASKSIKEVGKLVEIYKVGAKFGTDFRESMLKIGSAINEVSANSNSEAPYLIDLLKRMGGITDQADIAADEIIGIASALDQLGQTSEVSGTALNKIIIDMFSNTAVYANIARMSLSDFNKLLQTDSNEALLKFLEGLNGNSEGLSLMVKKLDDLEIDGARSIQVLASLSANTAMVRREQALANKAITEGTSLTNEYNIKNNNMAGNLEKIGHAIRKWFVNSELNKSLEGTVGWFAKLVEVPVERKLQAEGKEVAILVGQLSNANTKASERLAILEKLKQISPDIVAGLDAEKLNYEQLATNVAAYNDELVKRIVMERLIAEKDDILERANKAAAEAQMNEIEIMALIGKTNSAIISSFGTTEEKVQATIDFLVSKGAQLNKLFTGQQATPYGQMDTRSEEQRALDRLIALDISRNNQLRIQNELMGETQPIEERIRLFKEMLKSTSQGESSVASATGESTETIVSAVDEQISAYKKLKEEIGGLEEKLQDLLVANKPVPNTLIHELTQKRGQLAEVELRLKAIGEEIGRISSVKAYQEITSAIAPEPTVQDRSDDTPSEIKGKKPKTEVQKQWEDAAIQMAQDTSNTIFNIIANRHQAELDMELSKLDTMREAELANKNLTEAQKDAINEKYRKRDLALRQEAFKKEKAAAIAQAIINGALAVTKTYAEYGFTPLSIPAVIAQGIATVGQIAIIAAQEPPQYKFGGYTDEDPSDDKPVGTVHANEFVATAQAKRNPTVKPYLDAIDRAQRAGSIRSLNLPAVMQAEKTAMARAAGYAGGRSDLSVGASEMMAVVSEFKKVVQQLQDGGVEAHLDYYRLKRMMDKEQKAISKTK